MMKKMILAGIAMLAIAVSSCDEQTETMGNSLTSDIDKFALVTDTFNVSTRSIKADSVIAQGIYTYLGRIKDPETGSYITSHYATRFSTLENDINRLFPRQQYITNRDANNQPIADSCFVLMVLNGYQGDSLAAMKLNMRELAKPISERKTYYTNFDPEAEGYLRTDAGAVNQNKVYTMTNLELSDGIRAKNSSTSYYEYVSIPLNAPYTDRSGNTYNNYGTYVMQNYYAHPEYFKNSQSFIRNICPGFYLKTTDGLGVMSEIAYTQLSIYYHYKLDTDTVVRLGNKVFTATEEVLQTTHIENDKPSIEKLVADNSCTYLKTPAGIFTEVTLPIDDIKSGHLNDTITSAKMTFTRMNEQSSLSDIVLEEPTSLLMVERDSLYSFFEHNSMYNNTTSFLATYNSTYHTYSFENISELINHMWAHRNETPNWNKAVLIPVQLTTVSSSTGTSTVVAVANEMNINSVRLVGGSQNTHQPVRISIIYNKNQ